jgi:hypothetical protein
MLIFTTNASSKNNKYLIGDLYEVKGSVSPIGGSTRVISICHQPGK